MAQRERVICKSRELSDGGKGVRFTVEHGGEVVAAFAIRHRGKVYAYLNRCAHVGTELDWMEGEFFDAEGLYLVCSTHGATYAPENGSCVSGPCRGRSLQNISVAERDGKVFVMGNEVQYG